MPIREIHNIEEVFPFPEMWLLPVVDTILVIGVLAVAALVRNARIIFAVVSAVLAFWLLWNHVWSMPCSNEFCLHLLDLALSGWVVIVGVGLWGSATKE